MYCSSCGYSLRNLPHIHQCPECGQEYNARPLVMKGIFVPSMADPPILESIMAPVFAAGAVLLIVGGVQTRDIWRLVIGAALTAGCYVELAQGWAKFKKFRVAIRIQRRIEREEE